MTLIQDFTAVLRDKGFDQADWVMLNLASELASCVPEPPVCSDPLRGWFILYHLECEPYEGCNQPLMLGLFESAVEANNYAQVWYKETYGRKVSTTTLRDDFEIEFVPIRDETGDEVRK